MLRISPSSKVVCLESLPQVILLPSLANPVATILSACMMLDYLGESESARKIENIIVDVIQEGKVVTPDLGGTATTQEMAEYIASKI